MQFIVSDSSDPCFNLAVEEMLLKKSKEEYLLLSVNSRSVVSGKHQCIHREVNTRFITEISIPVIRRISGGGTVFHDEGNLNYAFIRNCEAGKQIDFPRHTKPLVDFLISLGLNPTLAGSDVNVNGFKISGNAEHVFRNRVLHHGTVLWNASLEMLRGCIRKDTSAYVTRAVASRPSPVMNLINLVTRFNNIEEFRESLISFFFVTFPGMSLCTLSSDEIAEAEEMAAKYRTWEWNYAYGPEYDFTNTIAFSGVPTKVRISVKDGVIHAAEADSEQLNNSLNCLIGCRHMPEDIRKAMGDAGINVFDVF